MLRCLGMGQYSTSRGPQVSCFFPFTMVPFWVPIFDPQPFVLTKAVGMLLIKFMVSNGLDTWLHDPMIWVKYSDLTRPNSPQMVAYVGNSPQTTARFRLVKYYNSLRMIVLCQPQGLWRQYDTHESCVPL